MSGTRTLTVVFTDIVGSTELLSGVGSLESERLLSGHIGALREEVARFGGTEAKTLGDGLMATFASARDALDCGVAAQKACQRPHPGGSRRVPIRIGISSGDVRIEGRDSFGTAVVEASRLCALAAEGQVLVSQATRLLARDYVSLAAVGELELKGLAEPVQAWEAEWSPEELARVRVVLADDAALVREGVARVLEEAGLEVVGQAENGEEVRRLAAELHPDVAIVDVRMPPTHTVEGLEAAERIRADHPSIGVLVLSQDIQPHYAGRLLATSQTHVGYLLKERVTKLSDFAAAVRRVAAGGTAFEPSVISSVLGAAPGEGEARELTPEEAEALVAQAASTDDQQPR
jgi:class 3 adenylate cyclase/DNA-binding NarL/FixJ family response regulator